ncbi:hypothetical protein C923_02770 [Plasmodium falciparum UGT5.1]|uniref:Plasmodium RESA N-terminal domain-containing protein n=1 Tax=Plasmodium falciparum UGT5.1 TaxID=1237627 RepID=W7JNE4_PLAFA|nr:hypothetical protein C923_02770 [Plasmodium falciparum UGT5.1]
MLFSFKYIYFSSTFLLLLVLQSKTKYIQNFVNIQETLHEKCSSKYIRLISEQTSDESTSKSIKNCKCVNKRNNKNEDNHELQSKSRSLKGTELDVTSYNKSKHTQQNNLGDSLKRTKNNITNISSKKNETYLFDENTNEYKLRNTLRLMNERYADSIVDTMDLNDKTKDKFKKFLHLYMAKENPDKQRKLYEQIESDIEKYKKNHVICSIVDFENIYDSFYFLKYEDRYIT